jgi:cyclase
MSLKNPYKSGGMFEGASPLIFANAKHLRKNMTEAEKMLWAYLKQGINGFKVRRQHPIGIYIADFYCHKVKLIIELDGSIHHEQSVKNNDELRQKELESWGYTIIRFANEEVTQKVEAVIQKVSELVSSIINKHLR